MEVIHTIGRRKTSVARIFISEGKGAMTVNKKDYTEYFPTPTLQYKVVQPFALTGTEGNYDVKVTVVVIPTWVAIRNQAWWKKMPGTCLVFPIA